MNDVETVLAAARDIIKTISVTVGPGERVWVQPTDAGAISTSVYPFVIVSKLNAEPGAWEIESFGAGLHQWKILIAVYLNDGPVVVTNTDDITVAALDGANEWYKALADVLVANLKLNGTVEYIGDSNGLFEYVTDNIIWNGQQHFGHLFAVPVYQSVVQDMSA